MTRYFTLEEASALLPEARTRISRVASMTAQLQGISRAVTAGEQSDVGGIPEAKALEARIDEELDWFREHGVQVKGVAPALLDFPARAGGRQVLLCWREGEEDIVSYHPPEAGYLGRRPIEDLDL